MRAWLSIPFVLGIVWTSVASADASADEAAIRAIVAAQADAWGAGDGVAYSRQFAPEGSFTNVLGTRFSGHAAFEQRHVEIFATVFKGTTQRNTIERLRFVTPDVALADVLTEVSGVTKSPFGSAPPPDGVLRTRLLQVFVRRDGAWWIEAYHNVDVKPVPPANP
jgi:uncharacterized protein (TIGR02246 family)